MNFSNPGSSPRSRRSIMSFSAAIMSFMRAMSCGLMFCIASDIWSTICCISWFFSLSISSSNRRWASCDWKS
ncbi:MAG: hypothetical protein RLZZ93_1414 [Actinomycetota bacterium]